MTLDIIILGIIIVAFAINLDFLNSRVKFLEIKNKELETRILYLNNKIDGVMEKLI